MIGLPTVQSNNLCYQKSRRMLDPNRNIRFNVLTILGSKSFDTNLLFVPVIHSELDQIIICRPKIKPGMPKQIYYFLISCVRMSYRGSYGMILIVERSLLL